MTRTAVSRSSCHSLGCVALLVLLALLGVPLVTWSQDAVRPSLAGESASEARRQDIERIPYNLEAGPIKFRFSATFGVEYNDNINLSDTNKQDDVIFRPQVNLAALWPITQLNTLRLDLGLSYAIYAQHSNANTNGVLISPGSELAFDIFVGDFRINIHDRPSLQQDPITEGQVSNTFDYGRFENTGGISVLWDLNKILLTLGYDHYTYVSTTSAFNYLNRNAEELAGTVSVAATSTTNVGVEAYSVYNYYSQNVLNDSVDASVGGFLETQISANLRVRVAGGYQWINFDNGGTINDSNNTLSDFYANILLTHQVNAFIRQTVAAGHENQLGINSNYITLNYVRHTISWNIIRNTLLSTEFFFEDADESSSSVSEHFNRYGGAITVGYQLTPHITLGARYQYTQKDSNVDTNDYKQNRVSVDATYSF